MGQPVTASLSETLRGTAGEAAVLALLTSLGVPCYIPFGDGHSADLIVEIGDKPMRVQVKSCGDDTATVRFRLGKRRRKGWAPYTDIDLFALYSSHYGRVLLFPHTPGMKHICVRFRETQRSRAFDTRADELDARKVLEEMTHGTSVTDQRYLCES